MVVGVTALIPAAGTVLDWLLDTSLALHPLVAPAQKAAEVLGRRFLRCEIGACVLLERLEHDIGLDSVLLTLAQFHRRRQRDPMISLTTLTIPMLLACRAFLAPLVCGRHRQDSRSDNPPQGRRRSSTHHRLPRFVWHIDELRMHKNQIWYDHVRIIESLNDNGRT